MVPIATKENLKAGNALIIVQRRAETEASVHLAEVTDNGEVIGKLGVGVNRSKFQQDQGDHHQLVWQRPAGRMEIKLTPSAEIFSVSSFVPFGTKEPTPKIPQSKALTVIDYEQ